MKLTTINALKWGLYSLLLLVLPTCTDLEEENFDTIVFEEYFKEPRDFAEAAGAAYRFLYNYMGHGQYFSLQEVPTDAVNIPRRGFDWEEGGVWLRLHQQQYNPDEFFINNYWQNAYTGISSCNRLIEQFERTTTPAKERFIAEMKVLRALHYYWLLDLFGNVPLITSIDDNSQPGSTTQQELFAFIETEIKENMDLLDASRASETYAKVDYYTAQTLLAALYLNAETHIGASRLDDALKACDAVINAGVFELEADFFENFKANNESSKENIFVIPFDRISAIGFNLHMMSLHPESARTYNINFQPWNGYTSIAAFYNSFDEEDDRKNSFIAGPQFTASGTPLEDPNVEFDDPDGPQVNFTPEINYPSAFRQDGVRIGKYEIELGSNFNLNTDMPIFRYAEILLNKAEILWRIDNNSQEALGLINRIRTRAKAPELEVLDAAAILAERGREFAFEAKRRTDLIRFDAFTEAWENKPATSACRALYPIPSIQLFSNPNLTQNPCY